MSGDRTAGRRIESPFDAEGVLRGAWPIAGDYWYDVNVGWCGVTPNGHDIRFARVGGVVKEHDDGIITVPVIDYANWTGSIVYGEWRES